MHPVRDYLQGSRQDQLMYEAMTRVCERDEAEAVRRRQEASSG